MHIGSKLKLSCACCVSCVCCAFARKRRPRVNQSIKGPHKATHGPKRSHISAPPQGGQPLHYKVMRVHFLLRRPGYGMPRLIQLINLMKCEERTDDGYMMTMKVVYIYKFCCWRVGGTRLCAGAPRGVVPPCGPPVAQQQESGSDLCSAQQKSYAFIASNLATLHTARYHQPEDLLRRFSVDECIDVF